ncbi:MAG: hypothetical protein NTV80_06795, partial [Verrucomicrobia bacterium]|nr:hypothetical protein [Verrucomicrobiota bacterium]
MKLIRDLLVLASGVLSALYLLNIGFGVVELIPDNVPIFGNLDEATATALLLNCLNYFGLDLGRFLRLRFSRYVGFLKDALAIEGLGPLANVVNVHGTGGGRGHPFPIGISQLLKTWQDHPDVTVGTDIYLGDLGVHNLADLYLLNAATRATLLPGQRLGSVEFEAGDGDYGSNQGQRYDPSAADLTIAGSNAQDVAAIYVKNDKLVVAYNRSGTVNYLTIPLDG